MQRIKAIQPADISLASNQPVSENGMNSMLSKCANPSCEEPFRYLGEGRLFQVERRMTPDSNAKPARKIEHYWLCARCSRAMRVSVLENEALLVFSDPDGTVINTTPIDTVRAA